MIQDLNYVIRCT